ncbi:MAG: hypothetical protein Q7O66_16430 [Dehalococcoidia bacterium]|nr:hypothetical protein [Dehalococcoidia bacterium]
MKCENIEVWHRGSRFFFRSYAEAGSTGGTLTAKTKKLAIIEAKKRCRKGTLVFLGQVNDY